MLYQRYITSQRWKRRRLRYYKKFGRICAACGTDQNITVHHMSYERLGHELDDDLLALCLDHHRLLHRLYPHTCREHTLLFLVDYQIPELRKIGALTPATL